MTGVVAFFESRESLLQAIDRARAQGLRPVTAFLPAYDPAILTAVDATRSPVPAWTLGGAIAGGAFGLAFTVWAARQWPVLRLGGKPLVAWPPFLIVAFEVTILIGALAAVAAWLLACRRARRGVAIAYEPSFSDADFGLLLACAAGVAVAAGEEMVRCGARAWRIV